MLINWLELIQSDLANAPFYYFIIWGIAFIYPIMMIFLTIGFIRNKKTYESNTDFFPVTVLVSSRNEEVDLPRCIRSLLNLDYPVDKLQIVLVNDRSDDNTERIIQKAAENNPNVLALNTLDFPGNELKAKARGVSCGMKAATGDWVFITDADAEVHPKWIKHSLSQVDEKTGMIGGALAIQPIGLLGIIERVSWGFVQMFNLGMSGWGVPFVCVGPNMAIRKDIYDNFGGLEKADFTVAEDLALFKMVMDANQKVITFASEETTISLSPVPSFRHLLSQQRRWFRGGIDSGPDYAWILYIAFWYGFLLMSYFIAGWLISVPVFLAFWFIKIGVDIFLFIIQQKKLGLKKHLRYIPALEFYHLFIFTYLPVSFLFSKKIHWMGDGYSIDYE